MQKIFMAGCLVLLFGVLGVARAEDKPAVAAPAAAQTQVSAKPAEAKAPEAAKPVEAKPAETTKETKMSVSEPKQPLKFDPDKTYQAIIHTSRGQIVCELNPAKAPLSVTNFMQLADAKYYDGLTFHRVEPGFVIQGGDPKGDGTGGPGYTVPAEIGLKHIKGALAWARQGDGVNPQRRSSGSQFYITLEATPFLDGAYTVFGTVTAGMDVAGKIQRGDKITSVEVVAK